jgi:hypothetical protein
MYCWQIVTYGTEMVRYLLVFLYKISVSATVAISQSDLAAVNINRKILVTKTILTLSCVCLRYIQYN